MTEQELREVLSRNLAEYRRLHGLTQAELAERLNYSDKSISKWERGDGIPDVFVLTQIADLYNITVDDLIADRPPRKPSITLQKLRQRGHVFITLLSVGLVALAATVCFFFLRVFAPDLPRTWLTFLCALIPTFIVLVVFAALWARPAYLVAAVTGLVWSVALVCHIALLPLLPSVWLIYAVAGVLQVLVILWYFFKRNSRRKG